MFLTMLNVFNAAEFEFEFCEWEGERVPGAGKDWGVERVEGNTE